MSRCSNIRIENCDCSTILVLAGEIGSTITSMPVLFNYVGSFPLTPGPFTLVDAAGNPLSLNPGSVVLPFLDGQLAKADSYTLSGNQLTFNLSGGEMALYEDLQVVCYTSGFNPVGAPMLWNYTGSFPLGTGPFVLTDPLGNPVVVKAGLPVMPFLDGSLARKTSYTFDNNQLNFNLSGGQMALYEDLQVLFYV